MKLTALSFAAVLLAVPQTAAPQDLESSFQSLKQAVESKKDAAEIKKLAVQTHELASKDTSEHGREVETYAEYALYATGVMSPPATMVDLLSTLETQNPKSKYLDRAYRAYFAALGQTGATAKIIPIAETAVANHPENPDVLLVLADAALSRNQMDRALAYAKRVIAAMGKREKPEGMAAADWERERNTALGHGYYVAGVVQGGKNLFFDCDKSLRAALPLIQGSETLKGTALFYLGVANYQLGKQTLNKARVLEAAKFSDQAAAIKGPFQQQAWNNAQVMKTEAGKMR